MRTTLPSLLCRGLLAVILCILSAGAVWAGQLGGDLRAIIAAAPDQAVPVIVHLANDAPVLPMTTGTRAQRRADLIRRLQARAQTGQKALRAMLRQAGAGKVRSLWLTNALALTADPALVLQMANFPGVASVTYDGVIHLPSVSPQAVTTAAAAPTWNVSAVHAPELWAKGDTGQGVVVASLDTGVDVTHPDLESSWRGGSDSWYDPFDPSSVTPFDDSSEGHGTAVMGVLVGGSSSGTAIGVAPGAKWIAAKIFDAQGNAPYSDIHAAFQWVLDPDGDPATDDAPDIVNNSWGLDAPGQCLSEFKTDIQNLRNAGIAVVFAAGNAGPGSGTSDSPANNPGSLAIGAVDQSNLVATFSSRGPSACDPSIPYPQLVAPGVHITSAVPRSLDSSGYMLFAGTSFSAPEVSGVMALLLSDPALASTPVSTLQSALEQSATDLGAAGPDNDSGYGLVDALAAFNNLTNGTPQLSIHDPTPPYDDGQADFGSVPVGGSSEMTITLKNVGGGQIAVSGLDQSGLSAPFSLVKDGCSGQSLGPGGSCAIQLGFAPTAHQSYTGSFAVRSDAPGQTTTTITLKGAGNKPPSAASLVDPPDKATNLATTISFRWHPAVDPEGDPITQSVVIDTDVNFSHPATFPAMASVSRPLLAGGAGGALLLLGMVPALRRRRRLALVLLLGICLVFLTSCGGGGSTTSTTASLTLDNFTPGTTYYWKVVAQDSFGGQSQSSVRSFTVGP